jgi:hypothetical protein
MRTWIPIEHGDTNPEITIPGQQDARAAVWCISSGMANFKIARAARPPCAKSTHTGLFRPTSDQATRDTAPALFQSDDGGSIA